MGYNPMLIANNILMRSFAEKRYVTPMKLQKILYFVASIYARKTGRTLLDDLFQTWAYGPVVSAVFHEFRPFSKVAIKRYARDAAGNAFIADEDIDRDLRDALDEVWAAAKNRTAKELSEITHTPGSAWWRAYQADCPTLDNAAIAEDETYLEPLRMR